MKLSPELAAIAYDPKEMAMATIDTDHKLLGALAARQYQLLREFDEIQDLDEREAKAAWSWINRENEMLWHLQSNHQSRIKSPVG